MHENNQHDKDHLHKPRLLSPTFLHTHVFAYVTKWTLYHWLAKIDQYGVVQQDMGLRIS